MVVVGMRAASRRCCERGRPGSHSLSWRGLGVPQLPRLAQGNAVDSASFVGWRFAGIVVRPVQLFLAMNMGPLIPIIVRG